MEMGQRGRGRKGEEERVREGKKEDGELEQWKEEDREGRKEDGEKMRRKVGGEGGRTDRKGCFRHRECVLPIQNIPVLSSPLSLVLLCVKAPKRDPVRLVEGEEAVGECLPETVAVEFRVALVEAEEHGRVSHLVLHCVLQRD